MGPTTGSQAMDLQAEAREARGFPSAEASLSRQSVGLKLQRVLSYLGSLNPWPRPVGKGDEVWLLDNTAYRDASGEWAAEFVAAAFSREGRGKADTVADVAYLLGITPDEKECDTLEKRLQPFLVHALPGRMVTVELGGDGDDHVEKLGPAAKNGICSEVHSVPAMREGSVVQSRARVPRGVTGLLSMNTQYAEPEGWAVISDIDDTIKVTKTSDPTGILKSTFVSEPMPVAGMPELYRQLQSMITPSSPFFYLSASPYNLYPFLRGFRQQYFPHGQLILRDESWMSLSGLLSNLTLGTQKYKVDRMERIHSWLPQRKMILIGDSTQTDPESYGEICRSFPGWVKLVLIRRVTDIAAVGIEAKNATARFEKAFEGVARPMWHVFEEPAECHEILRRLLRQD